MGGRTLSATRKLRMHHLEPLSLVSGPGLRAVVWVQGCTLGCPGCFNPATHRADAGWEVPVDQLVDRIEGLAPRLEGITVTGGEPLQQMDPLLELLREVQRRTCLSVVVFTGFTVEEMMGFPRIEELLANLDVVIAGRYERAHRLARGLRGSANQEALLVTGRYDEQDLAGVPSAEIAISAEGTVTLTGMDPPQLEP